VQDGDRLSDQRFSGVNFPTIDAAGHVAFQASLGGVAGVFAARGAGSPIVSVYSASEPVPGGGGEMMACLDNPSISNAIVAFFGSSCNGAPSASTSVRDHERMFRTRLASDHAVHDQSTHLDAGIFMTNLHDVFTAPPGPTSRNVTLSVGASKLLTVANFQTEVPGASAGVTFSGFSNPSVGDALIAFVGSTSAGELGVYTFDIATRKLSLVADTTTKVPGGAGLTFSDFPYQPAVVEETGVFYAASGGLTSGVYAMTLGTLRPLATMADRAPSGEMFSFIGAGARSSDGTLATFYGVAGSSSGIYSVAL